MSRTIGTMGKMQYGAPCFVKLSWHSSQEVSVSVHYHPSGRTFHAMQAASVLFIENHFSFVSFARACDFC